MSDDSIPKGRGETIRGRTGSTGNSPRETETNISLNPEDESYLEGQELTRPFIWPEGDDETGGDSSWQPESSAPKSAPRSAPRSAPKPAPAADDPMATASDATGAAEWAPGAGPGGSQPFEATESGDTPVSAPRRETATKVGRLGPIDTSSSADPTDPVFDDEPGSHSGVVLRAAGSARVAADEHTGQMTPFDDDEMQAGETKTQTAPPPEFDARAKRTSRMPALDTRSDVRKDGPDTQPDDMAPAAQALGSTGTQIYNSPAEVVPVPAGLAGTVPAANAPDDTLKEGGPSDEHTVMLDPEMQDRLMALRAQQDQELKQRFTGDVVVMFTDLVGSTAYYEKHGDLMGRQKMLTHNALLFPIIRAREGTIIKTIGDAIMCCYRDVDSALLGAAEMQQALAAFNDSCTDSDDEIHIRIGINAGPAIAEDGDLHGDAVNVAARVEAKADGGEILVSEQVKNEARAGDFELKGRLAFKGKAERVSVYRLRWGSAPSAPSGPRMIGKRYKIGVTIGRGPVGVVYSAEDAQLQIPVAIKVLHDFIAQDQESMSAVRERFRAMASLRHDAIVRLLDFSGPDSDETYYVMDRVDGTDLSEFVSTRGKLEPGDAARVILDIAPAVALAHEHAVTHANIKPENIFIDSNNRTLLADFGISAVHRVQGTRTGRSVASPAFQSPEQITNGRLTPRTDIYGLGAVLYYLVTGVGPYDISASLDTMRAVASGKYRNLPADVPPELRHIIETCMASRPEQRYEGVRNLISDLQAFREDEVSGELSRRDKRRRKARTLSDSRTSDLLSEVSQEQPAPDVDTDEGLEPQRPRDDDAKRDGERSQLRSMRRALIAVSVVAGIAFLSVLALAAVLLVQRGVIKLPAGTLATEIMEAVEESTEKVAPGPTPDSAPNGAPNSAPNGVPSDAPTVSEGSIVEADLPPTGVGFLLLTVAPVAAEVYIDQKNLGRTVDLDKIELPAGIHQLRLVHPKRQPHAEKIDIVAGKSLRRRIKLKQKRAR